MKASRLLTSSCVFLCFALSSNAACAFRLTNAAVVRRQAKPPPRRRTSDSLCVAPTGPTDDPRGARQDNGMSWNGSTLSGMKSMLVRPKAGKAIASILLVGSLVMGTGGSPAWAGLLDEFGADGSKIVEASAAPEPAKKGENAIDPTLRASYYYPTAKKRYLPRIQRVSRDILSVPDQLASGDWTAVQSFATTADNAILPLQLYVSSLDGQGLSMKNQYAIQMKRDAQDFERSYNSLQAAIQRRDRDQALSAVVNMGLAVADYRQQGRLSDDDGYIPSIDDMRRMAMRRPTVKVVVP